MSEIKMQYAASAALTISPASLASDANHLAGVEGDAFDNSSNEYLGATAAGKITTGTSPTTAKEIRVYFVGIMEDSTWPNVFDGTASAETVSSAGTRDAICKLAAVIATDATSNRTYYFGPVDVPSLFGGIMPKKVVPFVTHSTAAALNATGSNHAIYLTPYTQQIA